MPTLVVQASISSGIDRAWAQLTAPGTWWTGAQRQAIAGEARAARTGAPPAGTGLPGPVVDAARLISVAAHTVTEDVVADLEARGLDRLEYAEIAGVVGRLDAVDTFSFGIGAPVRPLPPAQPGEPSRSVVAGAAREGALVPTVGPASAPVVLSGVAAEHEAMHDLHGALYLHTTEMGDLRIHRDLGRTQFELIASRVSLLNECYY